jgi:hypothetical protein
MIVSIVAVLASIFGAISAEACSWRRRRRRMCVCV